MRTLEPGDVICFEWYGQTVSGVVVKKTWFAWAPCASTITAFSPETTWLHEFGCPGNYKVIHQPDDLTRQANVEEAHEWYRCALMQYEKWREFFALYPDYRLF